MNKGSTLFWEAVALLIGTIIGAGVLGIPYVVSESGLLIGILHLLIIGFVVLFINLFVGEIVLRTKGRHQLSGYIEKYLGKTGKYIMTFAMIFGILGALIAYTIGEGAILAQIFKIGSPIIYSIIFFIISSVIVILGLKATGKTELIITAIMIFIVIIISLFSLNKINVSNFAAINLAKAFLPFGVILFAFVGASAIPSMAGIIQRQKKKLKKAIIIGTIIPFAIYILFTVVMVGLISNTQFNSLEPNDRIATIALSKLAIDELGVFANIFAALSMFTSFLALALALVWMFHYDFKLNNWLSRGITLLSPLVIILIGARSFINIIGITGSFSGGVEGILITLAFLSAKKKSQRKPEYEVKWAYPISIFIIIIFILGIIYQIFEFL